ncbi:MAG: hypothetical protein OEZ10_01290 [Gammaproteobacteria bacterium]|nr:hypothetical protein [Gammaproteobacteria bacterium]
MGSTAKLATLVVASCLAISVNSAVAEQGVAGTPYEKADYALMRGEFDEARKGFEDLASRGHIDAAYRLGLIYQQGMGVPLSYEKARNWFRMAADGGHKKAATQLKVTERMVKN